MFDGHATRWHMVKRYSFAIPTAQAMKVLAEHQPILEVGAGNGYWAYEMRARGIDVVATEKCQHIKNNRYGFVKTWTEVFHATAAQAIKQCANHTLFLCWPCYDKSWAYRVLKMYKGNILIYVGEGRGGCTADNRFHDLLINEWDEIDCVQIPRWYAIYDTLTVWRRSA